MEIKSRFKTYTVNFVENLAGIHSLAESQETFFVFELNGNSKTPAKITK